MSLTPSAYFAWDVGITLASPFYWTTDAASELGVDGTLPTNGEGKALLPGSLLRGLVSDLWQSIAAIDGLPDGTNQALIDRLLGKPSGPASAQRLREEDRLSTRATSLVEVGKYNQPDRRLLDFVDLATAETAPARSARMDNRVAINSELGSAQEGALRTLILPWPVGTPVKFVGRINYFGDPDDVDGIAKLLVLAKKGITGIGLNKSSGYGRVLEFDVSSKAFGITREPSNPAKTLAIGAKSVRLKLTADRPVLIATKQLSDNHVASDTYIPGAALKGALAESLTPTELSELGGSLSRLVVLNAYPSFDGKGGSTVQELSAVQVATGGSIDSGRECVDTLGRSAEELIDCLSLVSPSDWKYPPQQDKLEFETRTRVRIDYKTGLARYQEELDTDGAEHSSTVIEGGGDLFSQDLLRPSIEANGSRVPIEWIATLRFQPEDSGSKDLIDALFNRPLRIGKTQAIFTIELDDEQEDTPDGSSFAVVSASDPEQDIRRYAFTLHSPACLIDAPDYADKEYSSRFLYETALRKIFNKVTSLTLIDHRAQEQLIGGYQSWRFRKDPAVYEPWILTTPGSCFLLQCDEKHAEDLQNSLEAMSFSGLPIPFDLPVPQWKHCPFLPEVGYGQIAPHSSCQALNLNRKEDDYAA